MADGQRAERDGVRPPATGYRLRASDVLLMLAIVGLPPLILAFRPVATDTVLTLPMTIGAVLAAPIVLFRRWRPLPLLIVVLVASLVIMSVTRDRTPLVAVVAVLLYTVASTTERRVAWPAGLVTLVLLYAASTILLGEPALGTAALATVAWTCLAVAAGDAVRNRREYIAAVEDRARRAEETRDEEARRRVAEERLRIARDVHDVVAHRMAVISVQAAAAEALLPSRPDEAAVALETVRTSAASVLDELGALLNVLRADDEAPLGPVPTLHDLDALIASFEAAGLHVAQESSGRPGAVPEHLQVVAYRVVQEALTNAQRHGAGRASLRLVHTPTELEIDVENAVRTPVSRTDGGSGFGLQGMRERVTAAGGHVEAGLTDAGRFRVSARLPHHRELAS